MKMYNKNDLAFADGYIVAGNGDVVSVSPVVESLLNKLEYDMQKSDWEKANKVEPVKKPEPFKRASVFDKCLPTVATATPLLDMEVAKTLALMEEIDAAADTEKAKAYLNTMKPLLIWADSETIVDCGIMQTEPLDLPVVGDPLALDSKAIGEAVLGMWFDEDDFVAIEPEEDDEDE